SSTESEPRTDCAGVAPPSGHTPAAVPQRQAIARALSGACAGGDEVEHLAQVPRGHRGISGLDEGRLGAERTAEAGLSDHADVIGSVADGHRRLRGIASCGDEIGEDLSLRTGIDDPPARTAGEDPVVDL